MPFSFSSQDALVARVAQANTKTIVVVNSVGPIEMEPWINNPNGQHIIDWKSTVTEY